MAARARVFIAGGWLRAAAALFLDLVLAAGAEGGMGADGFRLRRFLGAGRKDGGCTGGEACGTDGNGSRDCTGGSCTGGEAMSNWDMDRVTRWLVTGAPSELWLRSACCCGCAPSERAISCTLGTGADPLVVAASSCWLA